MRRIIDVPRRSALRPTSDGVLVKVLALFLLLADFGCVKEHASQPIANVPPRTFFWLFPDSSLSTGVSRQHLRWWGEDKDGYIVGYLISFAAGVSAIPNPDTLTYVFTAQTDSTVLLPIRQSLQNFLIVIRAIDNSFREQLPLGSRVKLTPNPFLDVNSNGILDGPDIQLSSLSDALDPQGARQVFPIRNSPPIINSVIDPDDPSRVIQPPETTFTAITFAWQGSDPDGDETIASYRIALNDSSVNANWLTLPSSTGMVTLIVSRDSSDIATSIVSAEAFGGTYPAMRSLGTVSGLRLNAVNKFYVEARDVAGDYSKPTQFPVGLRTWYVKKPKSRLLVISDYQKVDSVDIRRFYRDRFAGVAGGAVANYDEYDIRTGAVLGSGRPGILVPSLSIVNPMFIQTLKLYDYVFWYTDVFPSLTLAQFSLFYYSTSGGKALYTTEFQNTSDPSGALRDFAPIDSVSSVILPAPSFPSLGDSRIPKNYLVIPDSSVSGDVFPLLNVDSVTVSGAPISSFINVFMRPIYRRADSRYIYHFQSYQPPPGQTVIRYTGMPNIAVMRNDKNFVFFGFPLHYLNGTATGGQGLTALLNKIFVGEFGLQ